MNYQAMNPHNKNYAHNQNIDIDRKRRIYKTNIDYMRVW